MFENVVSQGMLKVIDTVSPLLKDFYLAGGTGLAIQLGHRVSLDLDFFSQTPFESETLLYKLSPDKIITAREGTIHCEQKGIKLSFLFYREPLAYPVILWRELSVADWKDITAEKFKAISQRGSKRGFYRKIMKVRELKSYGVLEFMKRGLNMAKIERFEDIQAWQKSRELNKDIYKVTMNPSFSKDFSLKDQIRRASVSIMANIAEGFGRRSNKEFSNFLNMAHGSAAEVQCHLYVALDMNYITKEDFEMLYQKTDEVSKMIQGFMNYLTNSPTPKLSNS